MESGETANTSSIARRFRHLALIAIIETQIAPDQKWFQPFDRARPNGLLRSKIPHPSRASASFLALLPCSALLHPEEAEGHSPLATSLSYTRQYHVYARIPS